MKKELENFIIESDVQLDYFNNVVDFIAKNERRIYVLNNYSNEEIEKLYKNPDYVLESANRIFEEAKKWVNNELNVKL